MADQERDRERERQAERSGRGNPLLARHGEALDLFTERVHAIRPDQWDDPTPCSEWTVRDLVNHLAVEQMWVPPLVREGRTIAEQGDSFEGDLLGDDPVAAWDKAATAAREAFTAPGALERTVELSYGESPAAEYCAEITIDAAVHAWDLARAIGADERIPKPLVDFSVRAVAPYAAELEKSGMFAAAVEPPSGADAQTRLLALLGRET
ncbi:TIGR03086 family metal-binding protein [Streptomyces sp. NBS 14/10]|uniref:TIGR03086 family metal-binding protein n=1 Tax=Streptomyces sp. NBS 14/10 TaxID=1945643 RepID=UPI000B7CC8B8|nr:TIGR03086 family metal-binding protein [Streptomyces sp. NBS 14/10]KAK1183098.1 TIGR03086 family metal-binding protein [Streptomyces sp. NBS 14/10]NUS81561.1 TIGR03086 family protein [Streptomyces sp.]